MALTLLDCAVESGVGVVLMSVFWCLSRDVRTRHTS